ncbi:MAG: hypothetical protein R3D98_00510 [Candidatus Krumholzibacteriia bacterium]
MRKSLITFALIGLLAVPAMAAQTYTYDWDGDADYLGCFYTFMSGQVGVNYNRAGESQGNGLLLTKNTSGGYALGFVATVWDLQEGDEVTVSIWRYDNNSAMPYFALWSHYNDALCEASDARGQDMSIDDGNCYGDQRLGDQNGWEEYTYTWTVAAGHTGMVIDAQVYGAFGAQLWVDDLSVTVPDHASVRLPDAVYASGGGVTAAEAASWTSVKNLFD